MIRKSEYFEQVDKYLDADLSQSELREFEIQMDTDSDLADELNFHLDVEKAMSEQNIFSLRENLNHIVQNQSVKENISVLDSFNFGLSEELSSFNSLNNQVNSQDIFNFGPSFPKIHLYQHKIAGKENIHQFYKEQYNNDSSTENESFNVYDEELFTDIQNSLEESDIFDLRTNLSHIAKSMPAHQYSTEDIENYVSNRMDNESRTQFENELFLNTSLAQDVMLIKEIDLAGAENEIMNLRASLKEIQKSSFNSSVNIEDIEGYVRNELSSEMMASFEDELVSNKALSAEIDLVRNIDLALQESDVMQLRSNLQNIAAEITSKDQTQRSFVGQYKVKRVVFSTVAASLILILGITGLLSRKSSQDDLYQKFHTTYKTSGIVRSVNINTNQTLINALQKYDSKDYQSALNLLQDVISRDNSNMVGHFYAAASLQETGKYLNAIKEYETVIFDKDNLFIEQAQWYIGLCYLQTNENRKAYKQLKKIADNEGFYQLKAQAIIKKIEYSD